MSINISSDLRVRCSYDVFCKGRDLALLLPGVSGCALWLNACVRTPHAVLRMGFCSKCTGGYLGDSHACPQALDATLAAFEIGVSGAGVHRCDLQAATAVRHLLPHMQVRARDHNTAIRAIMTVVVCSASQFPAVGAFDQFDTSLRGWVTRGT